MVDRFKSVEQIRNAQIKEIDALLTSEFSARRMNDQELAREGRHFAGWFCKLSVHDELFGIRIMVGRNFPFHPPEIFLTDTSNYLKFPHVEKTGKLCLAPAQASFSPARPKETIRFLIDQAQHLLTDSVCGTNRDDFITEFQSYWPGHVSEKATPFWTIFPPKQQTRIVYYWSGRNFILFGEKPEDCRRWIRNLNAGITPKNMDIQPTVFVWLKRPLYPEEYPGTGAAFRRLALTADQEIDKLLIQIAPQQSQSLPVIFGFETKAGPVLAGVVIKEPKLSTITKYQRDCKSDGFRKGRIPPNVLLNRCFGATTVMGANVFRADAAWIHARGGRGQMQLAEKCVGIFGCGSLGADVAFLLAKSGVGRFYLADNQVFSLDNVGRHLLGIDSVLRHKSDALGIFLEKQLPGLLVETGGGANIEYLLRERPKIFEQLDLIISTTGDWATDCLLNVAARDWPSFPPIVFGWTEAYGMAGHSLFVNGRGGCLACGMTEHGSFEGRVIEWQKLDETMVRATGCADFYQPYGVTDVASTKALIAELAIDVLLKKVCCSQWQTWIGDLSGLAKLNGVLRPTWQKKATETELSRRSFRQSWQTNPRCPFCKD